MPDYDLAEIYGYEVKHLNEQVKRYITRFLEQKALICILTLKNNSGKRNASRLGELKKGDAQLIERFSVKRRSKSGQIPSALCGEETG